MRGHFEKFFALLTLPAPFNILGPSSFGAEWPDKIQATLPELSLVALDYFGQLLLDENSMLISIILIINNLKTENI